MLRNRISRLRQNDDDDTDSDTATDNKTYNKSVNKSVQIPTSLSVNTTENTQVLASMRSSPVLDLLNRIKPNNKSVQTPATEDTPFLEEAAIARIQTKIKELKKNCNILIDRFRITSGQIKIFSENDFNNIINEWINVENKNKTEKIEKEIKILKEEALKCLRKYKISFYDDFKNKYLKYKQKYMSLKQLH